NLDRRKRVARPLLGVGAQGGDLVAGVIQLPADRVGLDVQRHTVVGPQVFRLHRVAGPQQAHTVPRLDLARLVFAAAADIDRHGLRLLVPADDGGGRLGVDRHDRLHAGHAEGRAGVDALDPRVSIRAAQDDAVKHAGAVHVVRILRPAGGLDRTVEAG